MKIYQISRLIRLPNLLMMALTLYLVRYCLVGTMLKLQFLKLQFNELDFFLLVSSVLLIAAAGYIINDYFDTGTDSVNKPGKVIVGTAISLDAAMKVYISLNIIAVLIGFHLAIKVDFYKLALIQPLSVGLLWFYSTTYKKRFLIGNLVVAFLSAMLPLIATIYEPNRAFVNIHFVQGYAFFAFILTLIREIVKDIEDKKGDLADGCKTLPIVLGTRSTKLIVVFLSVLTMSMIGYIQRIQFMSNDTGSFWYFTLAIQLPFLLMIVRLLMAQTQKEFHQVSFLAKIVMFTGILSMMVFYLSLIPGR